MTQDSGIISMRVQELIKIVFILFLLPSTAFGATYYASPSGSGTTCSEGSPCSLEYAVETKVGNGDTVIASGGTYTGIHSGNTLTLSDANITVEAATGETPVIDANFAGPTCPYPSVAGSSCYDPVVLISANGVTFDGFTVQDTDGRGIYVYPADNVTVKNCTVDTTYRHGIFFQSADGGLVEDCTVINTSRNNINGGATPYGQWSGGIAARNTSDFTVRRCTVYDSWGEGVSAYGKSGYIPSNITFEYNVIYNNWAVELYLNGTINSTARYNIVYGIADTTRWRNSKPSGGIVINDEDTPFASNNNSIYGNFLAYNGTNFAVWNATGDGYYNTYFYNNTLIEGYLQSMSFLPSSFGSNFIVKNNIIWEPTGSVISTNIPSNAIFDYNLWNAQPEDADARGSNDPSYAVPQISKTTGWTSLVAGELDGSEFVLQSASPAIDVGTNLGSSYDDAPLPISTWPDSVTLGNQNSYGTGWEIGGMIYEAPTAAPTLSSATIDSAGTEITFSFSEAVSIGSGGNGGWTIAPSGAAATLTYSSGDGTSSLVYTISRPIFSNETATVSYTQPGDGIEDADGNDLASITGDSVTNLSTRAFPTLTSATIISSGTTIQFSFSETVYIGSGGDGGWTIAPSGGSATLTYSSGHATSNLVYTISRVIYSGETATVDYAQPGDGVEDYHGDDLASLSGEVAVNNSTQSLLSFTSATVSSTGVEMTFAFSANANRGSGHSDTDWAINSEINPVTVTYSSGDGTSSLVYSVSRTIRRNETLTVDYTQPGDGIEDDSGNDLPTFSGESVVNNSVGLSPPVLLRIIME